MINPMEEDFCEHMDEEGCQETQCKHHSTKHPFNCNTNWNDEEIEEYGKACVEAFGLKEEE